MCQRVDAPQSNPCRQCAHRLINGETPDELTSPRAADCPLARIDWEAVRVRRAQRLARQKCLPQDQKTGF